MKIKEFDTITAVATSFGEGGISIIRISGESAFEIAQKIFFAFNKSKLNKKIMDYNTHTLTYGVIKDENNIVVDEVLLAVMKAPNTYTCENIVEINCHGGKTSVQRVLQLVLKNGARLAEKGEFTKRAFLNGRIDLSKAQAVIDVISAKTELSHKSAINLLEGKLKLKIDEYRDDILTMTAHIEASIDYPEHDEENINYKIIGDSTRVLINKIQELLNTSDTGRIVKEGIKTVILGKPNVGKSSILNILLDEERAIVSDIAGTTRDVLTEHLNINGVPINIVDTAGIRDTEDQIEKIGVQKSKEYAQSADLILLVLDNSKELDEQDIELLEFIKEKKVLVLVNKSDLNNNLNINLLNDNLRDSDFSVLSISAKTQVGFDLLKDNIQSLFFNSNSGLNVNQDILISNERNKASLYNAIKSLENVLETISMQMPQDFLSMDLLDAYNYLGEIIGESLDEDIIDKIFSEFCLGK